MPGRDYTPVVTPNGATLPWRIVDGVKVYHLIAEEVDHEFAPGLKVRCWGFNGRVHGPTIAAVEGDWVRILRHQQTARRHLDSLAWRAAAERYGWGGRTHAKGDSAG